VYFNQGLIFPLIFPSPPIKFSRVGNC